MSPGTIGPRHRHLLDGPRPPGLRPVPCQAVRQEFPRSWVGPSLGRDGVLRVDFVLAYVYRARNRGALI